MRIAAPKDGVVLQHPPQKTKPAVRTRKKNQIRTSTGLEKRARPELDFVFCET